jgi:hypothetical protein
MHFLASLSPRHYVGERLWCAPLCRLQKGPGPENVYDVIRASKKGGSTRNAGTLHLQAIQIEVRGARRQERSDLWVGSFFSTFQKRDKACN